MALTALTLRPGVRLEDLSSAAQERLLALDEELAKRKLKATVTSGKRSGGPKSHHHTGDAVDIVLSGDMAGHASMLQGAGFTAEFERKGQRNPNGSVATGDHVHVTLRGGKPADPYAVYRTASASAPAQSDPYALYRTATPARQPKAVEAADPYALYRTGKPQRGGKAETGALMESLLRGEHLQGRAPAPAASAPAAPKPKPGAPYAPARPPMANVDPLAPDFSQVQPPKRGSVPAQPKAAAWQWVLALGNAKASALNQMAEEARKRNPNSPLVALANIANAARNGLGPEAVEPHHWRTLFGAEKGKTGRFQYNALATLDYFDNIFRDPTGVALKGVGAISKATGLTATAAKVTAPVVTAARGVKTGVALQADLLKAERARDAALTALKAARGSSQAPKAGQKYGAAVAAQQAAQRAVAGATGTERLGVAVSARGPIKGAIKAEHHFQAALRRQENKVEEIWLKAVGVQKQLFMSTPKSIVRNTAGNFIAASHELERHGLKLTALVPEARAAMTELKAYRAGHAIGDAAELEAHAPGVLGTQIEQTMEATTGAGRTKNPILEAQSATDQLIKITTYKALKAKGLSPAEAAQRVKTALFHYGDRLAILQFADRYGLAMFTGFPVAATKSFVDTLVTRPDLLARFPRLQEQLFDEFPGSREAFAKLDEGRKTPFMMPRGEGKFLDVAPYVPSSVPILAAKGLSGVASGRQKPLEAVEGVLSGTMLGPTLQAAKRAEEEAGPYKAVWAHINRELMARLPLYRDAANVTMASRGGAMSHGKATEPKTPAEAWAQVLGGPASVRGETTAEANVRLAGPIGERGTTGSGITHKTLLALRSGKMKNRFARAANAIADPDAVDREKVAARKWLTKMQRSPMNFDAKGKALPGGPGRLRDAILWYAALEERARTVPR